MNYPAQIEDAIGFNQIKKYLIDYCHTDLGKLEIEKIKFITNADSIEKVQKSNTQYQELIQQGNTFYFFENLILIREYLSSFRIKGNYLEADSLHTLCHALQDFEHNYSILTNNEKSNLSHAIIDLKGVASEIKYIQSKIDSEGKLFSNASEKLARITNELNKHEQSVRKVLQSQFNNAKKQGWAGETDISIRNERLVFPILAQYKKKINCIVHDDSHSGKYLYIEPIECFEANNAIRELELERKNEIISILKEITAHLAPYSNTFSKHIQLMVWLDTLNANNQLAHKIKAIYPKINRDNTNINLVKAYHPLLYIYLSAENKLIEPLYFSPPENCKLVVISGPNAGGKSIALKTIALLQYMFQCGLPIPVDEQSKMPIFNDIYIDIGDNQSVENHLSSYSSHLLNMKHFIENTSSKSLYLIDEIGNSTEPTFGSAMAQAILQQMLKNKAFGVITTHYNDLKNWAQSSSNVTNAHMLFDLEKLTPLYKLQLGKAGSSYTFEIAAKVGIPQGIINNAKHFTKNKLDLKLEQLIAENQITKIKLKDTEKDWIEKQQNLNRLIHEYEQLKLLLQSNKQKILNQANIEAQHLLTKANKQIENTIQTIKENKAEKNKTKKVRLEIKKLQNEVTIQHEPAQTPNNSYHFKIGQSVKHKENGVNGIVCGIKKNKVQVEFGSIKAWVDDKDLQPHTEKKEKLKHTTTFHSRLYHIQTNFSTELDLRGTRAEEAINKLEEFIDQANLLGMTTLRIIHGRGHGILRKVVIEYLAKCPLLKKHEYESEQLGGDGVTLLYLK